MSVSHVRITLVYPSLDLPPARCPICRFYGHEGMCRVPFSDSGEAYSHFARVEHCTYAGSREPVWRHVHINAHTRLT